MLVLFKYRILIVISLSPHSYSTAHFIHHTTQRTTNNRQSKGKEEKKMRKPLVQQMELGNLSVHISLKHECEAGQDDRITRNEEQINLFHTNV